MRQAALFLAISVALVLLVVKLRQESRPAAEAKAGFKAERAGPKAPEGPRSTRPGSGGLDPAKLEYRNLTPNLPTPKKDRPALSPKDLARIESELSSARPQRELAGLQELGRAWPGLNARRVLWRYLESCRSRKLSEDHIAWLMAALDALDADAIPIYRAVLREELVLDHHQHELMVTAIVKTGTHGRNSQEDYDLLIKYVRHPKWGWRVIHQTAAFARPELDLLHRQLFDELENAPPVKTSGNSHQWGGRVAPISSVIQAMAVRKSEDGRAFLLEKLGQGRLTDEIISVLPEWQREEDVARIAGYLGAPDVNASVAATFALLRYKIPAAAPYLYRMATDEKNADLRRDAVYKLHALGDRRAIPMLIEMLKDASAAGSAHRTLRDFTGLQIPFDRSTAYETWKTWYEKEYRK